jgi:hypothetical protein
VIPSESSTLLFVCFHHVSGDTPGNLRRRRLTATAQSMKYRTTSILRTTDAPGLPNLSLLVRVRLFSVAWDDPEPAAAPVWFGWEYEALRRRAQSTTDSNCTSSSPVPSPVNTTTARAKWDEEVAVPISANSTQLNTYALLELSRQSASACHCSYPGTQTTCQRQRKQKDQSYERNQTRRPNHNVYPQARPSHLIITLIDLPSTYNGPSPIRGRTIYRWVLRVVCRRQGGIWGGWGLWAFFCAR